MASRPGGGPVSQIMVPESRSRLRDSHYGTTNLNLEQDFAAVTPEVRDKSKHALRIFSTYRDPPAHRKNYEWSGIDGMRFSNPRT